MMYTLFNTVEQQTLHDPNVIAWLSLWKMSPWLAHSLARFPKIGLEAQEVWEQRADCGGLCITPSGDSARREENPLYDFH